MDLIERMLRCGIPERTAVSVYEYFVQKHDWEMLVRYIRTEEYARGLERI